MSIALLVSPPRVGSPAGRGVVNDASMRWNDRPRVQAMEPDTELLARLRAGDESAFLALVTRYNPSLLRLARTFVPSDAVAEEVVQDTWIGVLRGVDRFEGRSSFKTWLFRILVNRARSTGVREHRTIPVDPTVPAVGADRFDASGAWAEPLVPWESDADDRVVAATWAPRLRQALDGLPDRQRDVVVLRDVEGMSSEDVCDVLDISEGNQRVLLHRGRSRLRSELEAEFGAGRR